MCEYGLPARRRVWRYWASGWPRGSRYAHSAVGATFGDVIPLQGGTPSDIVLDELRHRLYLVNNNTSRSASSTTTRTRSWAASRSGSRPISGAISMDGNFLYVASGVTTAQSLRRAAAQRDRPFA